LPRAFWDDLSGSWGKKKLSVDSGLISFNNQMMEVSLEKKLELINKIPFFSRFDEDEKLTMCELAKFQQFNPGDELIVQGMINKHLYFIINGTVDICIIGSLVTSLGGGGHVFGEMGFVYEGPASASVVANTKATAMIFDTDRINAMFEPIYYKLRMEIYRSCAEILAKRLIHTNSLAVGALHG
jgi:CRP-like cAMP-binding protein